MQLMLIWNLLSSPQGGHQLMCFGWFNGGGDGGGVMVMVMVDIVKNMTLNNLKTCWNNVPVYRSAKVTTATSLGGS